MKDWMCEALLETEEQKQRREKRKSNRKRKLIEEQIAIAIAGHNKEKAVFLADIYGITPQDFSKMVIKYSSGTPINAE